METHFNKRSKCPNDFLLLGKSIPKESKIGRGGVAVYANKNLRYEFIIYDSICPDAVVFEVEHTCCSIYNPRNIQI